MVTFRARTDSAHLHEFLLTQGTVTMDPLQLSSDEQRSMSTVFDSIFPHYAVVFGGEFHDPGIAGLYFFPLLFASSAHRQQWPGSNQIGNYSPFGVMDGPTFIEQHTDPDSGLDIVTMYAHWDTVITNEYLDVRHCIRKVTGFTRACDNHTDPAWNFDDAEGLFDQVVAQTKTQFSLEQMTTSSINSEGGWFSDDLFSGDYSHAFRHAWGSNGTLNVEVYMMPEYDLGQYYAQSVAEEGYDIHPDDLALFIKIHMYDEPVQRTATD